MCDSAQLGGTDRLADGTGQIGHAITESGNIVAGLADVAGNPGHEFLKPVPDRLDRRAMRIDAEELFIDLGVALLIELAIIAGKDIDGAVERCVAAARIAVPDLKIRRRRRNAVLLHRAHGGSGKFGGLFERVVEHLEMFSLPERSSPSLVLLCRGLKKPYRKACLCKGCRL